MKLDEAILELEYQLEFLIEQIKADIDGDDGEVSDVTEENRKYAKALSIVIAAVKSKGGA